MTMTLQSFLAEHAICRVWYASVASPGGSELVLNTDDDYCDSQSLLETPPVPAALDLGGTVTRDADGEYRWKVDSLAGVDLRDCARSTVYDLTVWGDVIQG
jgi:hypothetical protein